MKLDGIAISGFRSFGDKLTKISDLNKINIFIGKNNSGKSNILRFIRHLSLMQPHTQYKGFDPQLDYCMDIQTRDIAFGYQLKKGSPATGSLYSQISGVFPHWDEYFPEWAENIWIDFSARNQGNVPGHPFTATLKNAILKACPDQVTNSIASKLLNYTGGSPESRASDIAQRLVQMVRFQFEAHVIDAFRQITHVEEKAELSGRGLIKKLRTLQSPDLTTYEDSKIKFAKITKFVRELLAEPDAFLEIPAEQNEVYVSIRNKILPLYSLGTGIHELIILAAAVTIHEDAVFCIEEPEIHLHPELQKKFIRYIQRNTNNQYFITTHSNAFFDLEDVNIYHCQLFNKCTTCDFVTTHLQKSSLLSDLGYKASDILQANYVIWVEGPSDRIYLNKWITIKKPSLIEGLHYSIMFYGGRLLSHLAFNDPEVGEFIQLCRLNRNASILIDSDKRTSHSKLNETKKRIINDFDKNGEQAWVTAGRTIENYINEDLLNSAIAQVHPKSSVHLKWERYSNMTKLPNDQTIDKVAVAKTACSNTMDFMLLDLDKRLRELISRIERANAGS